MSKKQEKIQSDIIYISKDDNINDIINSYTKDWQVAIYYKNHNVVIVWDSITDISKKVYELDVNK